MFQQYVEQYLEPGDVSDHISEQRVASDVEWYTETLIHINLIQIKKHLYKWIIQ